MGRVERVLGAVETTRDEDGAEARAAVLSVMAHAEAWAPALGMTVGDVETVCVLLLADAC